MKETIRKCCETDIPRLFELFKKIYSNNPRLREKDYFDWQFKNTPYSNREEYAFWILREGDTIQAFLGYMPLQLRYDNTICDGCYTYNWFSLGSGVYGLKLMSRLLTEYNFTVLVGLSSISQQIFGALGFQLQRRMPRWVGILQPEFVCSLSSISNPFDQGVIVESHKRLMDHQDTTGIYHCDRFNPDDEFLLDQWPEIRNYCRRTGAYLNWRYVDIPHHNYRIIRCPQNQFGVYRIESIMGYEAKVVRVIEWTFKGDWISKALAIILQDVFNCGGVLIDFFCTAESLGRELIEFGFIPESALNSRIPYLFRPLHLSDGICTAIDMPPHQRPQQINFNEWYITKGDSDIDRVKL